jgi:hypothetical protein
MVGAEYAFTSLKASDFSEIDAMDMPGDEDEGDITLHALNTFILYGITPKFNVLARLPLIYWNLEAREMGHNHTKTLSGAGDLSLGVRWVAKYVKMPISHQFITGVNVKLPTGKSFSMNPMAAEGDTVTHSHFALGNGHFNLSASLEWWFRSRFPLALGSMVLGEIPMGESDLEFRAGGKILGVIQAMHQSPVFLQVYPNYKILLSKVYPDEWEGKKVENSGGYLSRGAVGVTLKFSDAQSGILFFDFPVAGSLGGTQLNGMTVSAGYRITL